jgi:predicted permease
MRQLRKSPGFALTAIFTLALGIGANTAMFTMVNRVLLAPLRFYQPNRIVQINTQWTDTKRAIPRITDGDVVDLRKQTGAFQYFSTYAGGELGVQLSGRAVFTDGYAVNSQFFSVLGIQPAYGRFFQQQDAGNAAVVSYAFARQNFGDPAKAIGKTLRLDQQLGLEQQPPYQIVGVTPPGLEFPRGAGVWAAFPTTPDSLNRTSFNYHAIARLRPGLSLSQAQMQLNALGSRLAAAYSDSNQNRTFLLQPLRKQLVSPVKQTLWFLMAAVAFVLLIACVNVANLFLARTTEKSREIAARIALGATRWRVIRQLLTESTLIALAGGLCGILVGKNILRMFVLLAPAEFPRLQEISLDLPVLAFTLLVSLAAALLFGIAPAWQASHTSPEAVLRQNSQRTHGTRAASRLREGLIVTEIALSLVLVLGAGLLLRSLLTLNSVDPGFRTHNVLVMDASTPAQGLKESILAAQQMESLREQLLAMPGIRAAAMAFGPPMEAMGSNGDYAVKGISTMDQAQGLPYADFTATSPDYFSTMHIPLIEGHDFHSADAYDAPAVAIISESLARQSFPGQDPIGRQIQCGLDSQSMRWMTIVGVVKDVRQDALASTPGPILYMPLAQHPYRAANLQFILHTTGDPLGLQDAVQRKVHSVDPAIAVRFTTMGALVADTASDSRFRTALLDGFAGLALLLAIVGVYGVTSYTTAQRISEIGIRMTLGATRKQIVTMFLRRSLQLMFFGIVIGLLLGILLSRFISVMLYGVRPTDLLTYGIGILAMVIAVLFAGYVPARRAAGMDPMQALRSE